MIVAYDGTAYYGWQEQQREQTVAGTLQACFSRVFHRSVKVVGASRTDAHVHALGQVARFYTDLAIDAKRLKRAWNNALPLDIHIRVLERASDTFHPQHDVVHKRYDYYIFPQRPLPYVARYGWWIRHDIDPARLRSALQTFIGRHDFRSFATGSYHQQSTVCYIQDIQVRWLPRYGAYQIRFFGHRFLQHMIRRLVGAACDVARGRRTRHDVIRVLEEKNPRQHFMTAPGRGLFLHHIEYTGD